MGKYYLLIPIVIGMIAGLIVVMSTINLPVSIRPSENVTDPLLNFKEPE